MDPQERQVWAQEILAKGAHQQLIDGLCACGRPWPCTIREMLEMLALGIPLDAAHTPVLVD